MGHHEDRLTATENNVRRVEMYLKAKGVPTSMLKEIRAIYSDRGLLDGSDIMFNRIYTALGIALVEKLGFGAKRCADFMHYFDGVCDLANKSDDPAYWTKLMRTLYEKTGIIVRTGTDDGFCEFATDEEVEEFNKLAEEKQKKGLKAYKVKWNLDKE